MWSLQIKFGAEWITVKSGFASRDAAEWAAAEWKQENRCLGDPFRAIRID